MSCPRAPTDAAVVDAHAPEWAAVHECSDSGGLAHRLQHKGKREITKKDTVSAMAACVLEYMHSVCVCVWLLTRAAAERPHACVTTGVLVIDTGQAAAMCARTPLTVIASGRQQATSVNRGTAMPKSSRSYAQKRREIGRGPTGRPVERTHRETVRFEYNVRDVLARANHSIACWFELRV